MKLSSLKRSDFVLYAVSACNGSVTDLVETQLGGATFLQLREKDLPFSEFLEKARAVRAIAKVPFVINDNIEIALESNADGVHIGQGDASAQEARARLGADKIVGVSCSSVAEAVAAERAGADYLGVGAVFSTGTKSDASHVDLRTVQSICSSVRIPVIAIGGISGENVAELSGLGLAGVAVVSALFGQGNVCYRTKCFNEKLRSMLNEPVPDRHGVILDLDGLLLDSLQMWKRIDREILIERGMFREDLLDGLHKTSTLESAFDYLQQEGLTDSKESFISAVKEKLEQEYRFHVQLFPETREFLHQERAIGKKLALLTSTPEDLVRPALQRLRIENCFDAIFCNGDKRFSDVFYTALEALGTGVNNTVVYDDSEYALTTARGAGFQVRSSL